jgi:hypothetical protein
MAAET